MAVNEPVSEIVTDGKECGPKVALPLADAVSVFCTAITPFATSSVSVPETEPLVKMYEVCEIFMAVK